MNDKDLNELSKFIISHKYLFKMRLFIYDVDEKINDSIINNIEDYNLNKNIIELDKINLSKTIINIKENGDIIINSTKPSSKMKILINKIE